MSGLSNGAMMQRLFSKDWLEFQQFAQSSEKDFWIQKSPHCSLASNCMYKRNYKIKRSYYLKWILTSKWECTWKNAPLTSSIFWVSLCNCLLAHKKLIIGVAVDGASDWFGNFSDNEYNFVLQKKKLGEMIPFRMGKMSVFQNMLYCFSHGTWHQYFIRNVTFSNQESFFEKKNSL